MSKLLNVKAAATYIGLTAWQVRSLVWDCAIPRVLVGRRLYVAVEDLDKWVREAREYAGSGPIAGTKKTARANLAVSKN